MSSKKLEFCGTTFFRRANVISGTYDFLCGSTAISETQLSNFSLRKSSATGSTNGSAAKMHWGAAINRDRQIVSSHPLDRILVIFTPA
jgi:hypothetical protein